MSLSFLGFPSDANQKDTTVSSVGSGFALCSWQRRFPSETCSAPHQWSALGKGAQDALRGCKKFPSKTKGDCLFLMKCNAVSLSRAS